MHACIAISAISKVLLVSKIIFAEYFIPNAANSTSVTLLGIIIDSKLPHSTNAPE